MLTRAAMGMVRLLGAVPARDLERALADPAGAQRALRERIAAAMAQTAYGREHGVRGPGDFERLPVVGWAELEPWVAREVAGEGWSLVPGRVDLFEPTSGSGGARKLVPYTAALRRVFTRMFLAWCADVLARGPRLTTGRFFVSLSPRLDGPSRAPGGAPVGLEDDTEYLPPWIRRLLAPWLVLPRRRRGEPFLDAAARALVEAADLEVVSVWSPTFLAGILDHLEADPARFAPGLDPARAAALRAAPLDTRALWPALRLVSCWDEAGAAHPARALAARLPGVEFQGKGLLATEAPVTLPWIPAGGKVPLASEVVIELEDAAGDVLPLHRFEVGASYGVVVSQPAGLCRYRLGDRVRVAGTYRRAPVLAFVGREGGVVDLAGEKLHPAWVREVLDALELPGASFRTLAPVRGEGRGYVLLVDRLDRDPDGVAAELDAALAAAHRYREARGLGQLAAPRVHVEARARERLAALRERAGIRRGDQKPADLLPVPLDPGDLRA